MRITRLTRVLRSQVAGTAGWAASAVAVSAVTGVLTARALGPEQRGTLALVLSTAGLCVLVGAFGTNVAVRQHLPRRELVNRRGYRATSGLLVVPLVIILLSVLYVVSTFVRPTLGSTAVGLSFLAYGIALYVSNQALDLLNAIGRVQISAKVNALGSFVCLGLVGACSWLGLGLEYIISAYAVSVIVQALVAAAVLHGVDNGDSGVRGIRILLRDGGRLLGLNLGQSLTYRGDTVLLGVLSDAHQVGNYAVAITPAGILRIPSNALGQVLFYRIASGTVSPNSVLRRIALLTAGLIPVAIVGWFSADWLFPVVFGPGYDDAIWPFRVLLLAELTLTPFLVLGRALAAYGSTWAASACGMTGVAMLVAACVVLIPVYGAVGAALASLIAYVSMSAVAFVFFVRVAGLRKAIATTAPEA